jgi:hypothetical protein
LTNPNVTLGTALGSQFKWTFKDAFCETAVFSGDVEFSFEFIVDGSSPLPENFFQVTNNYLSIDFSASTDTISFETAIIKQAPAGEAYIKVVYNDYYTDGFIPLSSSLLKINVLSTIAESQVV